MIGLMVLGLSNPAEKQPDACEEAGKLYDEFESEYPSCKDLAATDPNAILGYQRYCKAGYMISVGYGSGSGYTGMKYPNDYLQVQKLFAGCSGKTCAVEGRVHGNYFSMNRDSRPYWAKFPLWTQDQEKDYCYVAYGDSSDSKDGYNFEEVSDSYADSRFNITWGTDVIELGGDYYGHYSFGCDDDAPSTFNTTFAWPLTGIRWPPSETRKCKKGARSYYYKYEQDDGEYYRVERTLTDFWGTVKKTTEEQNGIRRYKTKVGLSNKLTVAAGIGISVAVSAVIVAIGCLIFYFVCKSKVAVKS